MHHMRYLREKKGMNHISHRRVGKRNIHFVMYKCKGKDVQHIPYLREEREYVIYCI